MKLKLLTAAMLAMAIAPMQANAATATGTINVTATVVAPSAKVNVAGPLAFGNVVQGSNGGATAATSYDVTVTNGVAYTIRFTDAVLGVGPNGDEYQMTSGANTLNFALYKDSTKVTKYSGNNTSVPIFATGTGVPQAYTLYAETILAGVAGNYADTITITVAY